MRPIPREEILRRFERWLDETLASETPPSGAAAEILAELEGGETAKANRFDLHALWSALTVVSQETKLQGRSFKKLDDTLAPWIPWIEDMKRRDDAWLREVELGARREAILVLVELRDRMHRAVETAEQSLERARSRPRLRFRWLADGQALDEARESAEALWKGSVLTLERLDEALGGFGVREIDCSGQLFDADVMRVADVEVSGSAREGEVLSVYRSGFEWNGELLRPAEVKVARAVGIGPEGIEKRSRDE